MKQQLKLLVLLFLAGICASSFAAVSDVEMTSCSVFSEGDKKEGDKKEGDKKEGEGEEEPDCE